MTPESYNMQMILEEEAALEKAKELFPQVQEHFNKKLIEANRHHPNERVGVYFDQRDFLTNDTLVVKHLDKMLCKYIEAQGWLLHLSFNEFQSLCISRYYSLYPNTTYNYYLCKFLNYFFQTRYN